MKKTTTVLGAALLLLLAGCATNPAGSAMTGMDHSAMPMSSETASSTSSAKHNSADTMFAQMMIVHHQQAVTMSETILAASGINPQVTALAQRIKAAQGPEIDKMKQLLRSWGEPGTMSGSMSMPGMMSEAQLGELAQAKGTEAAKLFLTQMIAHHQGAVESAKSQQSAGSDPEAIQLATDIVNNQQAEIDKMKQILAEL